MEIQELARVILTRWRVVLITTLMAVCLALSWSLAGPVSYRAEGKVVISTYGSLGTANDAYAGEQVSQQRAPTYAQLLRSSEVAARASDLLNGEISAQAIESAVDARIVSRLPLVIVTASMPTANDAVRAVAAVQQAFQQYVNEIERPARDGSLTAVRLSGDAPSVVREGNPARDAVLAGLLGLILGIVLAIYRDRTDPVLRGAGQVAGTGLAHLGTIDIGDDHDIAESFRRLAVECLRTPQDPDAGQVILVVGVDRDNGPATRVGSGLAAGLSACRPRTTTVDATSADQTVGLSDVLAGERDWADCVVAGDDGIWRVGPGTRQAALDALLVDRRTAERFPRPGEDEAVVLVGPSIVHTSTAVALTAVADSALVVAVLGETRVADVLEAKLTLDAMNCPSLGVVLLRIRKNVRTSSDVPASTSTPENDDVPAEHHDMQASNR